MDGAGGGGGGEEDEVVHEFHFLRYYKSGRVERLKGTEVSLAGVHPANGVASKDVPIDPFVGIYARLYLPPDAGGGGKLPVVVYFHGGGFLFESAFSPTYHAHANDLAAAARAVVVSVNYRLAPESPLPAAYDDAWAALKWIASAADPWIADHGDLRRVFLAGDSAGANIVHHSAMRGEGWPEGMTVGGMVMVHPFFWGKEAVGKEAATAEQRKGTEKMWSFICPRSPGIDDPWINPLAEDPARLCAGLAAACGRMLVCVGERDFLRERGVAYHGAVAGSGWGGELYLLESAGEGHVFHLFHPERPAAVEMLDRIVDFVNASPSFSVI